MISFGNIVDPPTPPGPMNSSAGFTKDEDSRSASVQRWTEYCTFVFDNADCEGGHMTRKRRE